MAETKLPGLKVPRFDRWAATALETAPDAADDEVRRAIVRSLSEDDWVSSIPRRIVAEAAAPIAVATEPIAAPAEASERMTALTYVAAERALRPAVEQFAERLFREPVADRVRQWQTLWEQTGDFSALRARLKRLQPALPINLPTLEDEPNRRLVELAAKWIVARPGSRGELRLEIDKALPAESLARFRAADEFRRAALLLAMQASMMFDDLPNPARPFKPPLTRLVWKDESSTESASLRSARTPVTQNSGNWWSPTLVIFVVIMLFRAVFQLGGASKSPPPRQSYTIPQSYDWFSKSELDRHGISEENVKTAHEWIIKNKDKIRPGSTFDRMLNGNKPTVPSPTVPSPNVPRPNIPSPFVPNPSTPHRPPTTFGGSPSSFGGASRSSGGAPSPPRPGPGR